ncbi:hypothetical protein LTR36_008605 [Oleoguttula mirabilis]|uniref:F-box domain-containing protein n=1 Tax=Oleoguttula mirabilis TaxID=1507867 RepID=A0AAV9JT96_9PEZI|nr:hypothetical protein LTR36_008605 [Oleoguttula mirabilis]
MPGPQSFESKLEACITALLREEYPFTQTSIINQAASSGAEKTVGEIVYLKNVMAKPGVRALDFLDLPAEIRNKICEYAVVVDDALTRQPAITMICRRLRKDTLPMFYALHHVEIRIYDFAASGKSRFDHLEDINDWLISIGRRNAEHIRSFTVSYQPFMLDRSGTTIDAIMAQDGLALVAGVANWKQR